MFLSLCFIYFAHGPQICLTSNSQLESYNKLCDFKLFNACKKGGRKRERDCLKYNNINKQKNKTIKK